MERTENEMQVELQVKGVFFSSQSCARDIGGSRESKKSAQAGHEHLKKK